MRHVPANGENEIAQCVCDRKRNVLDAIAILDDSVWLGNLPIDRSHSRLKCVPLNAA